MADHSAQGSYDRCGPMEWDRLERSTYNMVERTIILHYLDRYMPPEGRVLDAAGGTGTYTIELAKRGYDVVYMDSSQANLLLAREEVERQPPEVRDRVREMVRGSITDLSEFPTGHFDAVICLDGRLSHLVDCDSRERAADELARVTRPVGPVFVSVLSFYGALRKVLAEYPDDIDRLPEFLESRLNPVRTEYPDCFFFTPEEMVDLLARKGIEVQEYVGVQGLSAQLMEVTQQCARDPKRWEVWRDVLVRTCNHPSVVGISDHILAVGYA